MDEVREVRLHIVNTNTCCYVWDRDMRFRTCAGPDDSTQIKGMCKVSAAEQPEKLGYLSLAGIAPEIKITYNELEK